jgi:hypothetical protein
LAAGAQASTITLSDLSSDSTPAGDLDATYQFSISGPSELTLTATNTTGVTAFNINEVYFNAAGNVTGLFLTGVTHSAAGSVTPAWAPVQTAVSVAGFGDFDFGLVGSVGQNDPSLIGPGEWVDFVFTISGTGPFDMSDFVVANASGNIAAGKWVNGPGDDSAFGAAVPEPGTAVLVALGLLGLGWAGRRRR